MLYIRIGDYSRSAWCGEDTSSAFVALEHYVGSEEVLVEASGNELEAIRRYVTGVRMVPGREVIWTGDDAKFIIRNLDLERINADDMKRKR